MNAPNVSPSLREGKWPCHSKQTILGTTVPWEVVSYAEDCHRAARQGGVFDLGTFQLVRIEGPDARDFLNRLTTTNFKTWDPSKVEFGAILTGKAVMVAVGYFFSVGDSFYFLHEGRNNAAEYLEKFHFLEKLTIEDMSSRYSVWGLWNLSSTGLLESGLNLPQGGPLALQASPVHELVKALWRDHRRPDLQFLVLDEAMTLAWSEHLRHEGCALLGYRLWNHYRRLARFPLVGVETSDKNLVLEAGFDDAIARQKGCYPGQEVIERIFTYGQVNRRLSAVELTGGMVSGTLPQDLNQGSEAMGQIVSADSYPEDPAKFLGLAYLRKKYWDYEGALEIGAGVRMTRLT